MKQIGHLPGKHPFSFALRCTYSIDKLPDSGRGMDVKRREEAQEEEKRESERRKGRRKGETERAADVPMSSSTPCTSMIQE
jgi:hypothetical protein